MDTSDDPVTALVVGGSIAGGMAMSKAMAGGGSKMPSMSAGQKTKTAATTPEIEEADRLKKRMAASVITKDWNLSLSKPGLLGLGSQI